jgi:hypothetical protein
MKYIFPVLLACTAILSGCGKKPFDYRNKYTGNWHFQVESHEGYPQNTYERFDYVGRISYDKSTPAGTLTLKYGEGKAIFLVVDSKGVSTEQYSVSGKFHSRRSCSFSFETGPVASGAELTGIRLR